MTEPMPCPGICNTAWRRAETAYQTALDVYIARRELGAEPAEPPAYPDISPDKGDPIWCPGCQTSIRAGIDRLPRLAAAVAVRVDGRLVAQLRAERVGTPGGSPSGSPAFDTFDEIVQFACSWEDAVRALLGHQPAPLASWTNRGPALTAAARYLAGWHVQVLAHDDIGHEFGRELLSLVRRAERTAGLDRSVTRWRAPCRRCDNPGYQQENGSEYVECRHCHDRMTLEHYDGWARMYAAAVKNAGTAVRDTA